MSHKFEVRAETHEGATVVLRRLAMREEAENHPFVMKHWRRVWVAEREVPPPPPDEPPFPWTVEWTGGFAYVVDADGRKIASLLGSQKRREFVAGVIYEIGRAP
jgi:hypothetical protein